MNVVAIAVSGVFLLASQPQLHETTDTHLVQLDVTVQGPAERVAALQAGDFTVTVGDQEIPWFELDVLQRGQGRSGPRGPAVSYVFYFDQAHLTMAGRRRAFDMAHELIDRLVAEGSEAAIVSNGRTLWEAQAFTPDRETLHTAVRRVDEEPAEWDFFAASEERRVEEILELLGRREIAEAGKRTKLYAEEELARSRQHHARLGAALLALSARTPPKVVIYFADTLRQDPGRHYLQMLASETTPDEKNDMGDG